MASSKKFKSEKYLVQGCIWHYTSYESVEGIWKSQRMYAGRDGIFFRHNVSLQEWHDGYKKHPQATDPDRPTPYKEGAHATEKRGMMLGFDLPSLLTERADLYLLHVVSGAMSTNLKDTLRKTADP